MKAENAAEKVSVLVAMAVVTAMKAQAPTAKGSKTRPAMVDTKIESKFHPCTLMPAGIGTRKRRARPRETEIKRGMGFAPGQAGGAAGGAGAGEAAAAADAEASMGELRCWRSLGRVGKTGLAHNALQ